ncbi:Glucose dehydrogenase [FAD, quinone] [Gryllus bimaculatus]|nr:Glucose dehydrogenase [FAD, quinone] [Gryllus bimaculatus]
MPRSASSGPALFCYYRCTAIVAMSNCKQFLWCHCAFCLYRGKYELWLRRREGGGVMCREEFDFVIVGAGAAGSALALRLTERPDWNVLLLEAGGEEVPVMDVPFFIGQFQSTDANWQYVTTPQTTCCVLMEDSRCDYPTGRMVGGGTGINYMFAIRGNALDFDNWAAMGNRGWSFADVLPYFKKVEDVNIPELQNSDLRGHGGRVKITYPDYFSDVGRLILRAAEEAGFFMTDYNGEKQTGTGRIQTTTYEGSRWSANAGYLNEARARPNLFLRTRSFATRLVLEGVRARGVRYERGGHEHVAYATREVILSAGAVNSPAILMHSGIGPADHLQQLGIPVVQPLPVGHNLMDHTPFTATFTTLNQSLAPSLLEIMLNPQTLVDYFKKRTGPLTSTGTFEAVSFHEMEGTNFHVPGWPDVEILYASGSPAPTAKAARLFRVTRSTYDRLLRQLENKPVVMAVIMRLRPSSRGRVYLLDRNTSTPPQIDLNAFSDPEDVQVVLDAVRTYQKILASPSFQKVGARLWDTPVPGCEQLLFDSDDYWRCAIRQFSHPIYHPSGTCKMGPPGDPTAVVTPELKVVGVERLRVVDASIMPLITSGHLQLPTYMIGEKAADMIKEEHAR